MYRKKREPLVIVMAWFPFCCTRWVKSVFVAIDIQVVLIFTTSCHMP